MSDPIAEQAAQVAADKAKLEADEAALAAARAAQHTGPTGATGMTGVHLQAVQHSATGRPAEPPMVAHTAAEMAGGAAASAAYKARQK